MRIVVQRVSSAKVEVSGKTVGKIGKGLFVLVGVSQKDTQEIADQLAEKLLKLRVMSDDKGKINLSVDDANAELLVVSQFTLYADTSKGNRPSFVKAAEPKKANALYDYFVERLKGLEVRVQTGEFGAYMEIDCQLDGPVTIMIEK